MGKQNKDAFSDLILDEVRRISIQYNALLYLLENDGLKIDELKDFLKFLKQDVGEIIDCIRESYNSKEDKFLQFQLNTLSMYLAKINEIKIGDCDGSEKNQRS